MKERLWTHRLNLATLNRFEMTTFGRILHPGRRKLSKITRARAREKVHNIICIYTPKRRTTFRVEVHTHGRYNLSTIKTHIIIIVVIVIILYDRSVSLQ